MLLEQLEKAYNASRLRSAMRAAIDANVRPAADDFESEDFAEDAAFDAAMLAGEEWIADELDTFQRKMDERRDKAVAAAKQDVKRWQDLVDRQAISWKDGKQEAEKLADRVLQINKDIDKRVKRYAKEQRDALEDIASDLVNEFAHWWELNVAIDRGMSDVGWD